MNGPAETMADDRGFSRREWLTGAASAGVAVLLQPGHALAVEAPDPRVAALVRDTIGIDAHNHIDVAQSPEKMRQPDIALSAKMQQEGLSAICLAFALDYSPFVPETSYARFLRGLDSADAELRRNGMERALSAVDVRAAHRRRKPIAIQAIEGAHWLDGQVSRIALAHARGLRHFGLFHDRDATPPLGDINTRPPTIGGLTPLGIEAISECNRLGILVDIAHASADTTYATIKASRAPILFSHTGLNTRLKDDPAVTKALFEKLVSPDQARAIASSGGVVGVWTHGSLTPDQFGDNIRAMVDVCGIDHVCIGTDSKLTPPLGADYSYVPPRRQIGGMTEKIWADMPFGFYHEVVAGLLKAGFSAAEIGKIGGGNYLRVFEAAGASRS